MEHGVNGFIANNADEFAQYTIQLWQDRGLCERLGIAARKTIAENFSPEVIKDKLSPIINEANLKSSLQSSSFKQTQIIIDGVFFQLYKTGIARVWKSLLEEWANTEFADHILVLDRANTAPKINGIRYRVVSLYNYNDTESDRQMLQQICDEEGAELFISTYYTTPVHTPSVFMAYDMIPEVLGGKLNQPMWREKHNAIKHASTFLSISENTAKDLSEFFPDISLESITVAHCGVDPLFCPASENEINAFKYKYGINKPYFLLGGLGGYKNEILFLQAFAQLSNKHSFDIVATGAGSQLSPEWRQYTAGCTFHGLQLSDAELRLAYAGAVALVYPSQYEGFGMPVAEAMACGCPVITTPNASLPEVGGDAVIYVKDNDIEGMANALCDVQKPSLRRSLISAGLAQAQKFSWSKMADIISNVLINQTLESLPFNLREINLIMFPDWTQSEDDIYMQLGEVIKTLATDANADKTTLLIYVSNTDPETADLILSSIAMNLMIEDEIDITERMQISLIEKLSEKQWQKLLPYLQKRILLEVENQEVINKFQAEKLPIFEL
ncbi:MAG: glycosyltransferase [Dolichospermum sp. DET50]|nr:glycosyltransferase [Dolichospermum sp. DET66]MBS3032879.1 glycosyltransferase [Dolichospermum sp. DET67]MBS3038084.1 glycosyltransferase [Dolichospermum sp. DET50]QSX70626.1 MAG: glycosyltransferase [Dolichospermum sp. DET69]